MNNDNKEKNINKDNIKDNINNNKAEEKKEQEMKNPQKEENKNDKKAQNEEKKEDVKSNKSEGKKEDEDIIKFDTDNLIQKEEDKIVQPKVDEAFLKVNEELDRTKKQMLRFQADFENYKKRNLDITNKAYNDGVTDVITEFLPLIDSFENASKMLNLKDDNGFNLMKKQLDTILKALNVTEIESLGKTFDPNLHNAVMRIEDEKNSGKIIEVFQKGYKLKDKVLRHTMVKVAN